MTCTIDNHVYEIPNLWLAGYTTKLMHHDKLTADEAYPAAIRYWHEQALMAKEWEDKRGF